MQKIGMWILLLIGLTGCSIEASLLDLRQNHGLLIFPKASGIVSGSTQTGTAGTYTVQSSVGNYLSGVEQRTSDNTYKVFSSVQGALVSQ
ncbi:hypothetical protein [Bdellovibrio sp. HCB337]|uniref:hypothetical protein n=1 Tax=Bdellovibrio sp. HCB337 TaxID=3394358 RepID=UPI0039A6D0ED